MVRTVTTFNENLEALAQLTEQDLNDLSVTALRRKLSETGITQIERGENKTVSVNSARKAELVATIRNLTKKERIVATVAPELNCIDESELEDLQDTPRTWADPISVAQVYYKGIKAYTTVSQWDSQTQTYKAPGAILHRYASQMMLKLATLTRLSDNSEELTAGSKLRFRSVVLTEMKELGELDKAEWFGTQLLANIEYVRALVLDGMREVSETRKKLEDKRLQERSKDVEQVDTTLMVDRAYESLSELTDSTPSYRWREVSCALAFVTGRRMAELHSSAEFLEVDEYTVSFTGQAKAKGEQAVRYSDNPSYDIPTLIPARLVVYALDWLKANGKRLPYVEMVNSKYAKELGIYVKNEWYACTMSEMFANDSERGMREKHCTYHKLRQLYALSAVDSFKPGNVYVNAYMSQILGHSSWDTQTSQRYERDMELMQGSKTSTR